MELNQRKILRLISARWCRRRRPTGCEGVNSRWELSLATGSLLPGSSGGGGGLSSIAPHELVRRPSVEVRVQA